MIRKQRTARKIVENNFRCMPERRHERWSSCCPVWMSEASSTRLSSDMDRERAKNVLLQANEETGTCTVNGMRLREEIMNFVHNQRVPMR